MKCESCGNEMIGAAIICRACNHNNALHRRQAWRRPEPRHNQSTQSRVNGPSTGLPTINSRKDNDVNLLHFPSALNKRTETAQARQSMPESQSPTDADPPWRAELKERVRRIREKRDAGESVTPKKAPGRQSRAQTGESKPVRNPIVEAALNRLRWASKEMGGRGDGEAERRGDSVAQSPSRPVAQSHGGALAPSLPLSVLPSRSPSNTSTGKGATSAPNKQVDKQVRTRVSDIANTYEPQEPNAWPAPVRARLLAGVCDFEVAILAFLLIFGAYTTSNDASSFIYGSPALMALLLSAVVFTYQIVMLAFAGRTFGMALLKLRLINAGDEKLPVTPWQKLLRASAATIVFICFPLCLTAWFGASRRTLADRVSGTTVA